MDMNDEQVNLKKPFLNVFFHVNKIFLKYISPHQWNIWWYGRIFCYVQIFKTWMELGNGWKLGRDQNFGLLKNGWKFVKEVGICLMNLHNSWSYIMGQDPCGEHFPRYIIIWLSKFNSKTKWKNFKT
jgi:hypothetical protein